MEGVVATPMLSLSKNVARSVSLTAHIWHAPAHLMLDSAAVQHLCDATLRLPKKRLLWRHAGAAWIDSVITAAGRMASVQPSPRGGDGFNTPVVHSTQQPKVHSMNALEEIRAHALAAHATNPSKPADKPGADLTDDLLNL